MTIETFRSEIQMQLERLKRDSNQYKMAFDFGMIEENHQPIVFYFERVGKNYLLKPEQTEYKYL